jgi:hypothetical protein
MVMKFLNYLSLCLVLFLFACRHHASTKTDDSNQQKDSTYVWKKVLDSGAWKKSYNFQLFNHHDSLWVFHPDGNWYSTDGKNWAKSTLPNAIYNLGFLDYIQFKDAIYGLGHFEGNIEKFTFSSIIYRTKDLKTWEVIAKESNLPKRFFYHPFVFKDKIWIIGGEDQVTKYADIWNSEDGIHWIKQKDNLPFGKRSQNFILNVKGKLYLLGNDVWTSADALTWEKVSDEIAKGEIVFGYAPIVYDDKIWLLGCNRDGHFSSQILVSADGKNWKSEDAPWSPRGGIAATIFKNKIYITGGKYGGTPNAPDFRYSNDLWTLEKK